MVERKSWHNPVQHCLSSQRPTTSSGGPLPLRADDLHHIDLRRCSLGQQFGVAFKASLIAGIDPLRDQRPGYITQNASIA